MKKSLLIYIGLGLGLARALPAEGLSLSEAWAKAQANSPELAGAQAAQTEQAAAVGSAKAFLYPRLDWKFDQNWSVYTDSTTDKHSDLLRLRQDFSLWGGKLSLIQAVLRLERASQARIDERRADLYARLAQAYYAVAAENADQERLKELLKINEARVGELAIREKQGRTRKSELASARAQAAMAQAQLATQSASLASAHDQLSTLASEPEVSFSPLSPSPLTLPLAGDIEAIDKAPRLRALALEAEAAELASLASRAGYWPTLEGQLSRGLDHATGSPELMAGLSLSWEFFSGFATAHAANVSDARFEKAKASLQEARRDLRLKARHLLSRLRSRQGEIESLREAVSQNQLALKELEKDFRYAQSTLLELTQATQSYIDTARRLDRAICDAASEKVQLDALLGNLP